MVFYPQFCTYHAIQYLLLSGISVVFMLSVRCWNNKYLFIYYLLLFWPKLDPDPGPDLDRDPG